MNATSAAIFYHGDHASALVEPLLAAALADLDGGVLAPPPRLVRVDALLEAADALGDARRGGRDARGHGGLQSRCALLSFRVIVEWRHARTLKPRPLSLIRYNGVWDVKSNVLFTKGRGIVGFMLGFVYRREAPVGQCIYLYIAMGSVQP